MSHRGRERIEREKWDISSERAKGVRTHFRLNRDYLTYWKTHKVYFQQIKCCLEKRFGREMGRKTERERKGEEGEGSRERGIGTKREEIRREREREGERKGCEI